MSILKVLLFTLLFFSFSHSNINIKVHNKKVKNAQTTLIEIFSEDKISDVKLTLNNVNIPFYENKFKTNSFYALVPISYYQNIGKKRVIISYLKKKKREFTGVQIEIVDGEYLSEKINVQKSKVELNEKDKIRTKLEYQEAMRIYRYKNETLQWNEEFIMPMNSEITSDFGTKRVYNNKLRSYHSGIDFKAAVGTAIIASNDGIVKLAKNRFYAGNSIIIDHGQAVYTCYFHLNSMIVKKNQFVKKGEIIGYSGSSGRVTGPHLHFATRVHGILVEPTNLFSLLNSLNKD